ncbi:DUF3500 domain-containing protein [Streptomyces canus]|uniref:DUF3500 domain-containing protein n=1 Tax=Streptomyces canus TaxID=58343 RepID=UPI00339FA0BF
MSEYRLAAGLAAVLLLATACGSGDSESSTSTDTSASASATTSSGSGPGSGGGTAAAQVLTATQAFLATLDDSQKSSVQAERTEANLSQWSNLPDQLFERAGLRMDSLDAEQQTAVLAILKAALSEDGYEQVTGITYGDGVLKDADGIDLDFGADHYWIRVLGTPSETGQWTLQYGGHHLAVNVTLTDGTMTLGPTLWAAQPAYYDKDGNEVEPLKGETEKAFKVVQSLDDEQFDTAELDTAVTEIVLGAGQDGKTLESEGVKASDLDADQQKLLLDLIDEWITPLNDEQAKAKLADAKKNLKSTYFAWYGSTESDQPIYYRVQSPSYTIEFAHQQGQGANAGGVTHIHSIYRENGNDYGAED